jgi:hypothetical protein
MSLKLTCDYAILGSVQSSPAAMDLCVVYNGGGLLESRAESCESLLITSRQLRNACVSLLSSIERMSAVAWVVDRRALIVYAHRGYRIQRGTSLTRVRREGRRRIHQRRASYPSYQSSSDNCRYRRRERQVTSCFALSLTCSPVFFAHRLASNLFHIMAEVGTF